MPRFAMGAVSGRASPRSVQIGWPLVTVIAPSTIAPLAMAMLRATTSARITAEEPISSFSEMTSLPLIVPAMTARCA